MNNKYAVRYPNGFHGAKECCYAVWSTNFDPAKKSASFEKLDYISARKKIYCGEYARLLPKHPSFIKLKSMLEKGKNLLLIEVDGPPINQQKRGFPYDEVTSESPGLFLDEITVKFLLNDPTFPFGHGYTIGTILIGGEKWLK